MIELNTINKIIEIKADIWSERIALQMFSSENLGTYTYAKLVKEFKTGSEQIKKAGIKAGDRIVIISENRPEWVIAYLAALDAETTVVLIDPKLTPDDLTQLIAKSDPRLLIVSPYIWEKLPSEGTLRLPVLNLENQLNPFEGTPKQIPLDIPATKDPDPEVASILFTSGTSGSPKGVLVTHQSLLYCAEGIVNIVNKKSTKKAHRSLCILPLNHIAALTGLLIAPLLAGAAVTFVETVDKENIFAALTKTKSTILPAVPLFFDLIYGSIISRIKQKGKLAQAIFLGLASFSYWVRSVTSWNIGSLLFRSIHRAFGGELEYCFCGAAPLATEIKLGMEKLGFTILEGYGLTEAGVCVYNTLDEPRIGHVGKPFKDIEIRIDQPNPTTGEGEICIRGTNLMKGYFRDAEATAEVLRDAWFYTGDLGYLDAQGNLVITGRIKELIVTSAGKKAAPPVVEEYYRGIKGVKELAVFGMPAKDGLGEFVHAAIVLDPAALQPEIKTQDAFQNIWKEIETRSLQIPTYLRIQKIHIVKELPKTTSLKVKRKELKKLICSTPNNTGNKIDSHQGLNGKSRTDTSDFMQRLEVASVGVYQELLVTHVREQVARVLGLKVPEQIALRQSLFDLGIDSLMAVELRNHLELSLGHFISPSVLFDYPSLEALVGYLAQEVLPCKASIDTSAVDLEALQKQGEAKLVKLQTKGTKNPIFLVSGAVGIPESLLGLSEYLDSDRPCYSFDYQPGNCDIATLYVKEMLKIQPQGPYILGGYSFGAWVAFEMAQQLQSQNLEVDLLICLDMPAPSILRRPEKSISQETLFSQISNESLKSIILDNFSMEYVNYSHQWMTNYVLPERVFPVPTVVVRGETTDPSKWMFFFTPPDILEDDYWGWKQHSGELVDLNFIPGNHTSVITAPNVQKMAQIINSHLNGLD